MATHLRTELVVDALEMALWRRNPDVGLIHHMDRGVQFAALSFGKRFEEAGIVASMSRVGSALDNVFLESFVTSLGVNTPTLRGASVYQPWDCQDIRIRFYRRV